MELECFGGPKDGAMIDMPEETEAGWTHTVQDEDGDNHKYEVHGCHGELQLHYMGKVAGLL